MKKYKWIIILLNLLVLLLFFNWDILKKEKTLSDGQLVLMELAPVDPRSLMQGDYMRLSYAIAQGINQDSLSKFGYCVLKLEPNGLAKKIRLQKDKTPLNEQEYLLQYNTAKWGIHFGAESFFFEEGQAEKYEAAKYGGLKVDKNGNSILIGLYDEALALIE